MSKESKLSKEQYPEFPEQGLGFPAIPIIELPIDSLEAFDYENADKAKYSVDDLRGILISEIKIYRTRREKGSTANYKKVVPQDLNSSGGYRGSKSP